MKDVVILPYNENMPPELTGCFLDVNYNKKEITKQKVREREKRYRAKHKERISIQKYVWNVNYPANVKAMNHKSYYKNRAKILAKKKAYHIKNKDKILTYKKQYAIKHREKLIEYQRDYRQKKQGKDIWSLLSKENELNKGVD